MDITPEYIKEQVEQRELDLRALYDRMDRDVERYNLKKYVPKNPKDQAFTSNEPRTFADVIIGLGSQAKMKLGISWMENEMDREKTSRVEQLIRGALYEADQGLLKRMHPRLIPSLFYYICIPAAAPTVRVIVNTDEEGNTVWDIMPLNPRQSFFEIGGKGLIWHAYRRIARAMSVQDEWDVDLGITDSKRYVTVTDYWTREMHYVACADPIKFLTEPVEHGFKHLPFAMGVVGAAPVGLTSENSDEMKYFGESIYAAYRNTGDMKNTLMSWYLDIVYRNRKPYREFITEQGVDVPEEAGLPDKIQGVRPNEGMKFVPPPILPPDANNLLGVVMSETQRSSIPGVSYGEWQSGSSGYAIRLQSSKLDMLMREKSGVAEDILGAVCHEIVYQYGNGQFQPTTVRGIDKGERQFVAKISPEDVKGDLFIKVGLSLNMPQDEMQKMTMASLAKKEHLMSDDMIDERILEIEDIDAENKRKRQDFVKSLPPIMLFDSIEELKMSPNPADQAKAMMLMGELMKMTGPPMGMSGQGGGMPSGGQMPPQGPQGGEAQRQGGGPNMPPPEMMTVAETGAPPTVQARPEVGQTQMQGG